MSHSDPGCVKTRIFENRCERLFSMGPQLCVLRGRIQFEITRAETTILLQKTAPEFSHTQDPLAVRIEKHPPCQSRLALCEARKRAIPKC